MKLSYRAVTQDGQTVKGILEAKGISETVSYLRSRKLLPIEVIPKNDKGIKQYFPFFKKVGGKDIVFFTQQLSSMLTSGLTLLQGLNILKEQVQNPFMVEVINSITADVEDGKPFSEALDKHQDVFSSIYRSLIKASEASGLMDKVLSRLAINLQKQATLNSTVKSALMYPAIVVTGMIVVVGIMMIFVIPQLTIMYQNLNIELPLPTQIVVSMSNFVTVFWPFIIGGIIFAIFIFKRWHKTLTGKLVIDNLMLQLPVFGNLTRKMVITEISRTFGLLVGSGTLVVDALKQTAETAANIHYKNAVLDIAKRVEKGVTVGDSTMFSPLFPPLFVEMVKIGEKTGKLDESLLKVSEYFEGEVDAAVKGLTSALEPLIIVALGAGIAFLITSIITPIYNLTSQIK